MKSKQSQAVSITVLLIEDNKGISEIVGEFLSESKRYKYSLLIAETLSDGLKIIKQSGGESGIDVILLDLGLPDSIGLNTFHSVLKLCGEIPIVILTAHEDEDDALVTIRQGAQDYLLKKDLNYHLLDRILSYAIERQALLQKSKNLVKKLDESESRIAHTKAQYRNIFDKQVNGVSLVDLHENFVYANPAVEHIFGVDKGDLVGRNLREFVNEDTYGVIQSMSGNRVRGESDRYSIDITRQNGDVQRIVIIGGPWFDDNNQIIGTFGIILKDSQLHDIEKALHDSESKYLALIETMNEGLLVKDEAGKISLVNKKMTELTGFSTQEILGGYLSDFINDKDHKIIDEQIKNRRSGSSEPYEIEIIKKDGSIVPVSISPHGLFDDDGKFKGTLAVITNITSKRNIDKQLRKYRSRLEDMVIERTNELSDAINQLTQEISERERTEVALRESEETALAILNASNDPILLVDTDGIIISYNKALLHQFETTAESLEDANIQGLFPPALAKTRMEHANQAILNGAPEILEDSLSDNYFRTVFYPVFDESGNVAKLAIFVYDITKQKKMEFQLQEERSLLEKRVKERTSELIVMNSKLTRAGRLKDEFLANMSHELRTPLNTILGMTEVLTDEIYGSINSEQREALSNVDKSGRHLLELITDILDLSKIEAGKMKLQIDPVGTEHVCQMSLQFVKEMAQKKRLRLSSYHDPEVTTIMADELRLKQILVNLLSNAVKFTPDGGTVGLDVTGDKENNTVHFIVSDTGIGIADFEIDRLFQPFTQVDSSFTRKYEGTGLGLSLVYRMVEMHGGSVTVDSEEGKGSKFTITLPWDQAGEAGATEKSETIDKPFETKNHENVKAEYTRDNILLVDDNETTLKLFSNYLTAKGFKVSCALDGRQAVEMANQLKPDIILMDIQMPVMDGLEATKQIRLNPDLKITTIVALTALAMKGDRERCLGAGADEYLSKPVGLKKLLGVLQKHQTTRD